MVSEFALIETIRRQAASSAPGLVLGIGDDTAILLERAGRERLITTDLLVEDIHFKLSYTSFFCLGYKTLAVSISDIIAMGGIPEFALLSLGIPHSCLSAALWQEFFDGYFSLAQKYHITLIGGDTSASPEKLMLDSIVTGSCLTGKAIRRRGAQIGDSIYVTGSLGASAAGLRLLRQGSRLQTPDNDLALTAMQAHLLPAPPVSFGQQLGATGLAHAMMDVSDGLAQDLSHLCQESQVAALIDFEAVPLAPGLSLVTETKKQAFSLAISGGEDYQLLFTANPQDESQLLVLAAASEIRLSRIGEIHPRNAFSETAHLFLRQDERVDLLPVTGYDHFRS